MNENLIQKKAIPLNERMILALDVDSPDEAKKWVETLKDQIKFYKVGWQLFLTGWLNIVDWIVGQDLKVMLDLKFFDISNTVASAIKSLRNHGISFITVHGDEDILKASVSVKNDIKILAVTVLTSMDDAGLQQLGFKSSVEELVLSRAKRALEIGCDGVVASGLEVNRLRKELGHDLLIFVPGVRATKNREDDQKRIVTVREAFLNGADYVILGRPIRNDPDPEAKVKDIQEQIEEGLRDFESVNKG